MEDVEGVEVRERLGRLEDEAVDHRGGDRLERRRRHAGADDEAGRVEQLVERRAERLEHERRIKAEVRKEKRDAKNEASGKVSGMDMASVIVLAQLKEKKRELRWRPKWEYYLRQVAAWAFSFGSARERPV